MDIPDWLYSALYYASLAPSGHNTQPWNVRIVSPEKLLFSLDRDRLLPATDPDAKESLVSLGCFMECFDNALSALGYEAEYLIHGFPDETNPIDVIINKTDKTEDSVKLLGIKRFFTNRNPFLRDTLGFAVLDSLTLSVSTGSFHFFPALDRKGLYIADAIVEANKKQFCDDDKLIELANWLRFSRREAKERQDGITAEMLGLGVLSRLVWYGFFSRKTVFSSIFRKTSLDTVMLQVNNCAGFAVITGHDSSYASIIGAGRDYIRLALASLNEGIALHPMSQVMEEEPFSSSLADELGLPGVICLVLRIGYSDYIQKKGIRRPPEAFVIREQS
ncbi:hypothetical protein WKV44_06025 [Spirochaetia bacterium 38H-sp]|uniref:Nitroreductase n=1 Tax=Rarispira pelagica TaxID=3141764 RepID=A0ABU9UBR0_9SPIR